MTAESTVLIFPFAGGSKDSFNKWKFEGAKRLTLDYHNIPEGAESPEDIDSLSIIMADYIAQKTGGGRFFILAYSFGSIIGYSTVEKLIENYGIVPEIFITVGCVSPDRFPPEYISFEKKDIEKQFNSMSLFGGRKIRDGIFQNFILPAIEKDFKMARTYKAEETEKLPVSIYAFISDDDGFVRKEDVVSWKAFTSEEFSLIEAGKGHFSYMVGEGKKLLMNFIEDKINH